MSSKKNLITYFMTTVLLMLGYPTVGLTSGVYDRCEVIWSELFDSKAFCSSKPDTELVANHLAFDSLAFAGFGFDQTMTTYTDLGYGIWTCAKGTRSRRDAGCRDSYTTMECEFCAPIYCWTLNIDSFISSMNAFDPSAGEKTIFSGTMSETCGGPVYWTVIVRNSWPIDTGTIRKTFSGSGKAVSVSWDGKDSDGMIIENGTYTVTLKARTSLPSDMNWMSTNTQVTVKSSCNLSSVSISSSEVRPAKTGDESLTKATIGIALANPAPSSGCEVKLSTEPLEGTGGHSHDGNRKAHAGKVEPDSVVFIPGESMLNAVYTSGEIAGTEKIIAEVLDSNGSVSSMKSVSVDVKFPDLEPLSGSEYYTLSGATSGHSLNHYGQFWTNWMIDFVASDYFDQTEAMLQINDMSLEWGGLFDICGTWSSSGTCSNAPKGGHKSHRKGTSVDINRTAYKSGVGVAVDKVRLNRIAILYDAIPAKEETIHYDF